jgi:hypothetical protein
MIQSDGNGAASMRESRELGYHPKVALVAIALAALIALMAAFAMLSTIPKGRPGAGLLVPHRTMQPPGGGATRDAFNNAM